VKDLQIAFVGAGNMASSIIGGLVEDGVPAEHIRASDPNPDSLQQLMKIAPVRTCDSNSEAVDGADVVVLAVKPQVMAEVTADLREKVSGQASVVISIAAGITIASLEAGLGSATPLVRCMPNTPALLRCGATALFANPVANDAQRQCAETTLAAVGTVCWVSEESQLDAVTAVSGSGPAYFFAFMEALVKAGVDLGLSPEVANQLTLQTALGAARMALEGQEPLDELRRRVTSPGGTTERALESFSSSGLDDVIRAAVRAANDRSIELGRELGQP
jgi:pyrroline-5-carboxylate reductase